MNRGNSSYTFSEMSDRDCLNSLQFRFLLHFPKQGNVSRFSRILTIEKKLQFCVICAHSYKVAVKVLENSVLLRKHNGSFDRDLVTFLNINCKKFKLISLINA